MHSLWRLMGDAGTLHILPHATDDEGWWRMGRTSRCLARHLTCIGAARGAMMKAKRHSAADSDRHVATTSQWAVGRCIHCAFCLMGPRDTLRIRPHAAGGIKGGGAWGGLRVTWSAI